MKETKKTYILYQYDQFNDDFIQIMEYYSLKELQQKNNIKLKNNRSIYHFIYKNIEEVKHLLKDKYIIIEERL